MPHCHLAIRGLELCVELGWPDAERMRGQIILIDIDIALPTPPKACLTDNLDDTVCYSIIANSLREQLNGKQFHLVEFLTQKIYALVKTHVSADATISVHLTKFPKIEGLTGGVRFSYTD